MSHIERIYADRICSIGHKLTACDGRKYKKMVDFIDANLPLFAELIIIKDDMVMEEEDVDD